MGIREGILELLGNVDEKFNKVIEKLVEEEPLLDFNQRIESMNREELISIIKGIDDIEEILGCK